MDNKTLKYLRVFIPGIILLLGLYPFYNHYFKKSAFVNNNHELYNMIITFLSILLGSLYYQLNIQDQIKRPAIALINQNIFIRLITINGDELTQEKIKKLKKNNTFMDIYYKIIDEDSTLKIKGENIRFNGIFLTTTADISLIFTILFVYYNIQTTIKENIYFYSMFLPYTAIISFILHIITCYKHIKLCNKQLNYIENNYKKELKKEFERILNPSINENTQ